MHGLPEILQSNPIQLGGDIMWLLIDSSKTTDKVDIIANSSASATLVLNRLHGSLTGLVVGTLKYGSPETMYDVLMYAILNGILPQTVQIAIGDERSAERIANLLTKEAKYVRKGVNYVNPEGQK